MEEKKEAKEKKMQGKENNEQFHQEGKFVVLKLASDEDDDIKLSVARVVNKERDEIEVKMYKSERKDLYNLLDLPNQKFNLEDVVLSLPDKTFLKPRFFGHLQLTLAADYMVTNMIETMKCLSQGKIVKLV